MKKMILATTSFLVLCSGISSAFSLGAKSLNFTAPTINGTSANPFPEEGDIINDSSSNTFKGYTNGSWVTMGVSGGTVLAPGAATTRLASDRVTNSGSSTCSVGGSDGGWLTGCTLSSGLFTLTINSSPAPFSNPPNCTCSPEGNFTNETSCNIYAQPSTSQIQIQNVDKNGVTWNNFHIICVGDQ